MSISGYEVLDPTGFLFQGTSARVDLLHADFGDGYRTAARIGAAAGLRTWKVQIAALPDDENYLVGVESRANYLWNFFLASKAASNRPFWIQDPKDDGFYLAEFVDDQIDYEILCGRLYSTGLQLRQRRVAGVLSPITSDV